MYLYRCVYYSRNAIKKLGLPVSAEIKSILAAGARNNPAAGLTGALVFNEQYFAQVIEGDRHNVSRLLWRIAADPRQEDMVIMSADSIRGRSFDDWSMGYVGHSEEMETLYLKYGIAIGFDPGRMGPESLTGLVQELVMLGGHGVHHHAMAASPATA
ncbi:Sensors of blue-light using FAD [Hartmannibacter diazotrophicus]|uniref:Sensors of blue-light using FAD n=1 Tax=Hartmannibacter diazotrophicus TaxID=1482074 RepID=A0A2C9D2I7_9HYPH|nr:BLUF domain-containing protein [Hartmannibacter diazotrophicus]SON54470.1 Sensors of blue-light using FAD [Hartmannibacter diazotrophicus]